VNDQAQTRRAVVLLSGGLDSATTLAVARSEGWETCALSFEYGQRHRGEVEAARTLARQLGAREHRVVELNLRAIGGSALTADIAVPKDRREAEMAEGTVPVTYVPARNLVFLSVAAGYAEVVGALDIFIGVNAVDYSGYPDCRRPFIDAFENAATLGTTRAESGARVRVRTPLVGLSKAEIIALARTLGVDLSLTRSCYDPLPDGAACGRCDSCLIRLRGFKEAGVPDPARYAPGTAGAAPAAGGSR
jgi:7-cyano-7-deazaguanine synthase